MPLPVLVQKTSPGRRACRGLQVSNVGARWAQLLTCNPHIAPEGSGTVGRPELPKTSRPFFNGSFQRRLFSIDGNFLVKTFIPSKKGPNVWKIRNSSGPWIGRMLVFRKFNSLLPLKLETSQPITPPDHCNLPAD